jgi:hypothetical protein
MSWGVAAAMPAVGFTAYGRNLLNRLRLLLRHPRLIGLRVSIHYRQNRRSKHLRYQLANDRL